MLNWQQFKNGAAKLFRPLPGVAKVVSMAGSATFALEKFFAWSLALPSGLHSVYGIIFTTIGTITTANTNIVTRYFNMTRREQLQILVAEDSASSSADLLIQPSELPANWFHPAGDHKSWNFGYKFTQLFSAFYIVCSTTSGYISAFALAKLIAMLPYLEFDSSCEETQSASWKIIAVHLTAVFLAYASVRSFKKANLAWVREYYRDLFNDGNWRNISKATLIVTATGVTTNTVCIFFSNRHSYDMLAVNSLCHISSSATIPESAQLTLATFSCISNIIVNGLMTLAAVHKRHTNVLKTNLNTELEKLPTFKKLNPIILVSIIGDSVNNGLNTAVSVAKLPETINKNYAALSYHPGMCAIAGILGAFAIWNQYALDHEGYIKELQARTVVNLNDEGGQPALLTAEVIYEPSNNRDIEAAIPIPVSTRRASYFSLPKNSLSNAQHATVFGSSLTTNQSLKIPVATTTTTLSQSLPALANPTLDLLSRPK